MTALTRRSRPEPNDYVHGAVTYTLTYTQMDVVGQFSNTDDQEFYWDTNGTTWTQPFSRVTAQLHVSAELVPALSGHNACYQGAQGSTRKCQVILPSAFPGTPTATPIPTATPASEVILASAIGLGAGENMTVSIGFANGTFTAAPHASSASADSFTPAKDTVWGEVVGGILLLLALGAIPFALIRRFAFGQRDAKGSTIIPEYELPTGTSVMESATLVGHQQSAISAQIVSFAVRGKLRIIDHADIGGSGEYSLELVATDGLDDEESRLLRLFFPTFAPGESFGMAPGAVAIEDINQIKGAVDYDVLQKGWKTKVSSRSGIFTALGVIALLIIDIVIVAITEAASAFADVAVPVTLIAIVVAFATAFRRPVLTVEGARQRDYLLGMRLYLTVAEEDRIRMLQSPTGAERVNYGDKQEVVKLYEQLLPYAILFGVEDEWSKVLALQYGSISAAPNWYVSDRAFSYLYFAESFQGLSQAVSASTTPIPVSSGGGSSFGGSFGGGFSGGGGGGGGGGGR